MICKIVAHVCQILPRTEEILFDWSWKWFVNCDVTEAGDSSDSDRPDTVVGTGARSISVCRWSSLQSVSVPERLWGVTRSRPCKCLLSHDICTVFLCSWHWVQQTLANCRYTFKARIATWVKMLGSLWGPFKWLFSLSGSFVHITVQSLPEYQSLTPRDCARCAQHITLITFLHNISCSTSECILSEMLYVNVTDVFWALLSGIFFNFIS